MRQLNNYSEVLSDRFVASLNQHFDADTAFYFQEQLTTQLPKTFEVIYAELNGIKLVPIEQYVATGALSASYEVYDSTGRPDYVGDAATDLPFVDAKAERVIYNVWDKGLSLSFTYQDVRHAAFTGKSIIDVKQKSVIRGHAQDTNQLIFFGDSKLPGWINNPKLSSSVVANGAGGSPLWANKTPDEMVKDLNDAITQVLVQSNGAHMVDTIAISLDKHRVLQTTRIGTSTQTALDFFNYCNPNVELVPANEIDNKFTGNSDGFIAYVKSNENFWFETSNPFWTETNKSLNGLFYVMSAIVSHGGIQIRTPMSQIIKYGI